MLKILELGVVLPNAVVLNVGAPVGSSGRTLNSQSKG
jgi:hypothetical protein